MCIRRMLTLPHGNILGNLGVLLRGHALCVLSGNYSPALHPSPGNSFKVMCFVGDFSPLELIAELLTQ